MVVLVTDLKSVQALKMRLVAPTLVTQKKASHKTPFPFSFSFFFSLYYFRNMALLGPWRNALLGYQFVLAWMQRISLFGALMNGLPTVQVFSMIFWEDNNSLRITVSNFHQNIQNPYPLKWIFMYP